MISKEIPLYGVAEIYQTDSLKVRYEAFEDLPMSLVE
jgi:hypothetical protein